MNATAAFRAALGPPPAPADGAALLGLEHEYRVVGERGPVDFRGVIHSLAVPGRRLDPGDRHAYRCPSGLALTCDDEEAEVASPPVPLGGGFTAAVDGWAGTGRDLLTSLLRDRATLEGYSTHLSAAVSGPKLDAVAARVTCRFAPALMLMLDGPRSHGVFVRPRPGRIELCGDYAIGPRLGAVTAFLAGAVRACTTPSADPPPLALTALGATGRPGWEVDRRVAFGFDLYREGRAARLPLVGGGTMTAQEHLERAWDAARHALEAAAASADLVTCDRIVAGDSPLGVEGGDEAEVVGGAAPPPSAFGGLLMGRSRPAYRVRAAVSTWSYTIFEVAAEGRTAYASVPGPQLDRFLTLLDSGRLDVLLGQFLAAAPAGGRLADIAQTAAAGLWDALTVSPRLVPPEPGAGRLGGATPIRAKPDRPVADRAGKPPSRPAVPAAVPPDRDQPRRPPTPSPLGHAQGHDRPPRGDTEPATDPAPPVRDVVPPPPPAHGSSHPIGVPSGPPPSLHRPPGADADPTRAVPSHPTGATAGLTPSLHRPPGADADPTRPVPSHPTGATAGLTPSFPPPTGADADSTHPVPSQPTGATAGVTPSPPPVRPTPPAVSVPPGPGRGPRARPRRRASVLVLVVLTVVVAVGVAVAVGVGPRPGVQVVATSVPESSSTAFTTSATTAPTTSTPASTTSAPASSTSTSSPTTTPVTTVPATVPTTTPPSTSAPATTTTTTPALPPTVVFAVARGCVFTPATLTTPAGTTVRFRNPSAGALTVVGSGPAGTPNLTFSLAAGAESADTVLKVAGSYQFGCSQAVPPALVITVTP